jgi:hypothetical protein
MGAPNEHWPRWIISSIAQSLKTTVATPESLPFLVEGLDDRTQVFEEATDRAECRINGPWVRELSHGYWRVYVDINIMLLCNMDGETKNVFRLDELAGKFLSAMGSAIATYRTGTIAQDPDNDGSLLGCLLPRSGKSDSVRVIHFGQLSKTERLRQAEVDGRYVMYLSQ